MQNEVQPATSGSVDSLYRRPNPIDVYQPQSIDFSSYLREGVQPPLEFSHLSCVFTDNPYSITSDIHIGGDASIFLRYKNKAAFAMSYKVSGSDLLIFQMQGSKKIGYRINTGMDVVRFFADQTRALLNNPINTIFDRVILPRIILGIDEDQQLVEARKDGISGKYNQLRCLMGMDFDSEINAFVLEKPMRQ